MLCAPTVACSPESLVGGAREPLAISNNLIFDAFRVVVKTIIKK